MKCFWVDSTVKYNNFKGFGESRYIICPVCWNASIKFTRWEDGTEEISECPVCERMMRILNSGQSKDYPE
jgi:hypothetical protein